MNTEQIPKSGNAEADPVSTWGRLTTTGKRAERAPVGSAGVVVTACAQRKPVATRETQARGASREAKPQPGVREDRNRARRGVGEARSTDGSRVMPVEGRGLGLGTGQEEAKAGRLA